MSNQNYELEGSNVVVLEPMVTNKTKGGLTRTDQLKKEEINRMVQERGHLLIAKGPEAKISAEPGDYVILSPSGFATATLFKFDGVNGILLDSVFIAGRVKDPSRFIKEDEALKKQLHKEKNEDLTNKFAKGSTIGQA